jgi:hypothetical protein
VDNKGLVHFLSLDHVRAKREKGHLHMYNIVPMVLLHFPTESKCLNLFYR